MERLVVVGASSSSFLSPLDLPTSPCDDHYPQVGLFTSMLLCFYGPIAVQDD
jgi:hypothetical protein